MQHCDEASSVPVAPEVFDPCMIAWSELHEVTSVLQTQGRVRILEVEAKSNIFYDSPQSELKKEWTAYEEWLEDERQNSAPSGANQMFHSDLSYWWFDVNQQILKTAIGAMGIALAGASVVIFISSRSFVLTVFAGFSVLYVLAAATAFLVGLGWNLGFLESVLFAILIGIRCSKPLRFRALAHAHRHEMKTDTFCTPCLFISQRESVVILSSMLATHIQCTMVVSIGTIVLSLP